MRSGIQKAGDMVGMKKAHRTIYLTKQESMNHIYVPMRGTYSSDHNAKP